MALRLAVSCINRIIHVYTCITKCIRAVSYTHLDVYKRQLLYSNEFEAAEKAAQRSLELDPYGPNALQILSFSYAFRGRHEEALVLSLIHISTGREIVLTLIDLASGQRQLWKRIDSESRTDQLFVATPDLKYYAYPFPRYSSVLYTVENLH